MLGIRYEWVCIYRVSVKKTRFHVNCYKWRDIFSFTETGKIQSVQRQKKYFKHLDCNHSFQILRIFLLILWMRILRPENNFKYEFQVLNISRILYFDIDIFKYFSNVLQRISLCVSLPVSICLYQNFNYVSNQLFFSSHAWI